MKKHQFSAKKLFLILVLIWLLFWFLIFESEVLRRLWVANSDSLVETSVVVYQNGAMIEYAGGENFLRLVELSPMAAQGTPIAFYHVDFIYSVGLLHLLRWELPEAYFCVDIQYSEDLYITEKEHLLQLENVLFQDTFYQNTTVLEQGTLIIEDCKWSDRCAYTIVGNEGSTNCITFCDSQRVIRYLYVHRAEFPGSLEEVIDACEFITDIRWW